MMILYCIRKLEKSSPGLFLQIQIQKMKIFLEKVITGYTKLTFYLFVLVFVFVFFKQQNNP
jgi:hypothetical protein